MHKAFVQRKKFRWHSLQVQEENRYLLNEMNEQLHETSINWRSLAKFLGISDHRGPKKSSRVTSNLTFDGSGSNTLFGLTLTGLFLKRQCKVTPVIPSWTGWSVGFTSLLWTDLRIFMSTVSTRRGIVSPNASMVVVSTCTSFMALKNRHAHAMLPSVQHVHRLLGQHVISNHTRMELWSWPTFPVGSTNSFHVCHSCKMRRTCRTYIMIDAPAWITLSTMCASKNTKLFTINIWSSCLRHLFW